MWDADHKRSCVYGARANKQKGVAAVEFALLVLVFFTLVFGILELARMIYLFNTLQEVTRRAAVLAMNSPFDQGAQEDIRKKALFQNNNGNLILGEPITFQHLRLEYLSFSSDTNGNLALQRLAVLPADPATNRLNCLANPYATNCIRYIRVQVCDPGSSANCDRVPYQMLFPLIDLSLLSLPRAQTVVPAQSLGYRPGDTPAL